MASLRVFCTGAELEEWVRLLCEQWQLGVLAFKGSNGAGEMEASPSKVVLTEETVRVFLFPIAQILPQALTLNSVKARDWGWVDVRPGAIKTYDTRQELLLSEIHGEDFVHEPVHPARFVRWLKSKLRSRKSISYGVRARNTVTGGEGFYRDIGYTSGAEKLFHAGVQWSQLPNGRVVFMPAGSASRGSV